MEQPLYVALIKAHTGLGGIARKLTKYEYTHVALCLEDSFEEFITFSRRRHFVPMDAGFMRETRACYAFGQHTSFKTKIFRLPVAPQHYAKILRLIALMENDPAYIFNTFSMATMPLLGGVRVYKAFNCMSFVGLAVRLAACVPMAKPYYKYSIPDLDRLLQSFLFFEGELPKTTPEPPGYMQKPSLGEKLHTNTAALGTLAHRMLCGEKAVKGGPTHEQ